MIVGSTELPGTLDLAPQLTTNVPILGALKTEFEDGALWLTGLTSDDIDQFEEVFKS